MPEPTGRLDDRWAIIDGAPMYARVSVDPVPDGLPPVVLVHGLTMSGRYMVPLAEQLAPLRRVYAVDLPGFGRSVDPGPVLAVGELADALAHWLAALGIDRAVVLGHSFGCQVAAAFAVRHPERLERAVLVAPILDPAARKVAVLAVCWLRDTVREPLSLKPILLRDLLAAGPRRALCMLGFMLRDRIEAKLGRISVPTLVVHGARSAIAPRRWAEEVAALLPRGRLVVIPDAPHTVNFAAPGALAREVRAFLDVAREEGPTAGKSRR